MLRELVREKVGVEKEDKAMLQRAVLAACGGGGLWAALQAKYRPLHVVWDLDNTLLLSLTPLSKGVVATQHLPAARYFDIIDDDFPFVAGRPNARTTFRPGARAGLAFLGLFCTQHVFTAAQASESTSSPCRINVLHTCMCMLFNDMNI
jgi:hypothetical protein